MTDRSEEAALLRAYASGDLAAARSLTLRLGPRLIAFARRMLGGDQAEAEDVAQEVFLRLWRQAGQWQTTEASLSTWAFRVASNLCIDRLRRQNRGVALQDAPEPPDEALSQLAQLAARDRDAALTAALGLLPERQRQAVVLRHLEEMANPEIAAVMGISAEAVESLLARGKRALQALLVGRRAELGYEDESEVGHV